MKSLYIILSFSILGIPDVVICQENDEENTNEFYSETLYPVLFPADISGGKMSPLDSIMRVITESDTKPTRLTDDDFKDAAKKLGVEVPVIKAVVEIEAGKSHEGFHASGMPLINFDLTMFRRFAQRNGINLSHYIKSHSIVFASPNVAKYGSRQAAQHARLAVAYTIDKRSAIEGTFWGMFQIGGFNWRKCGAGSIEEFVELMSRSEKDQLDLFVKFIDNTGLTKHLREKNWAAFARGYNGPSYARRNYHTRLAKAYAGYIAK